ncbi:glycosyltransferase family 39 protein, partial [Patescibacteria group bacterium]|nr:glycosyltransferase family 39 protein [Patescibacteria group bacterium]
MKKLDKIFLGLIIFLAIFLRFVNLGSNPPSLYWEEAALGYDAYSILKTGKDFHGNPWPLVAFESFGDYKPSLYFYTTVPFIALFDLTPLAVRFPSALFGSLTVLLVFLFAKQFFKKPTVPLLSALFLCLSPWHLQLSRAGFEANLGLFLVTLGAWLFTKGAKKPLWLILSVIPLGLSMYAYHANRVLVPLLGLSFGLLYLKKLLTNKSKSLIAIFLFILISLPLSLRLNTPEVKQRFLETSAFSDSALVIESNQLISQDGGGPVSRLIHHRYWFYTKTFLDHYLDHFNFNYLFISGDSNPRHSTQLVGSLYLIQLPLLIFGLFSLFKNKKSELIP